ncbi:unnamed protein product [Paramecium pentaurelia]|uniref:Uncharacterized protein n=1 Tax=Paramecium pentaurelia TaxID=43138 RepID=A0A8S1S4T3_9CILI|nr:unnamed protein product [Paramecium pentaurelia]
MNTQDEILLLKKCICEFLNKLLPTIKDPLILTRQRLSQFKTVLLDELKTIQDVYFYVQTLQFQEGLILRTDPKIEHYRNPSGTNLDILNLNSNPTISEKRVIPNSLGLNRGIDSLQTNVGNYTNLKIENTTTTCQQNPNVEDQLDKEIPKLGKDIFFKRPSTRKLSIKTKDTKAQENNYKPIDEIQKLNVYGQRVDTFSVLNNYSKKTSFFDKETLLNEIKESEKIIRKHTTTLNAVYSRSFEILTGDKEQNSEQLNSIQQSLRAQQDIRELQNAQRNATLKGYSIYAKKDKDIAKQRIDEIAQINDKKKLYF